jgi:hypothetical protein
LDVENSVEAKIFSLLREEGREKLTRRRALNT